MSCIGSLPRRARNLREIGLACAVAFTAGVAIAISVADARGGGLLARYFEEYAGGGSCKWRGESGQQFHSLLMLGLLAWPAGIGAIGVALTDLVFGAKAGSLQGRALVARVGAVVVVVAALLRLASLHAVAGARAEWCCRCW